ncbi:hypothetical protein PoB_004666200 [Plakobranchus ocellatus]|uniref:Uncharacterized protein n=1 Tax=Plakobranchus ocellatus TaxID=259542 RepID=A0AAV4BL88_9GAST|nr:hypothetical protein PoB_004666200 [Plakobranchus ocellatus]
MLNYVRFIALLDSDPVLRDGGGTADNEIALRYAETLLKPQQTATPGLFQLTTDCTARSHTACNSLHSSASYSQQQSALFGLTQPATVYTPWLHTAYDRLHPSASHSLQRTASFGLT